MNQSMILDVGRLEFRGRLFSAVYLLVMIAACISATADQWAVDLRPQFREFGLSPESQRDRGTCSVFAVCGVCEYEWAVASGSPQDLSEEFANWARHRVAPARADGGCFHHIIPGIQRYGICAEALMPYRHDFVPELVPSRAALEDAIERAGVRCVWLKRPGTDKGLSDSELAAILESLRDGHPAAAGLTWFKGKDCLDEGGVLDMAAVDGTGADHSVILVGYREDDELAGGGAFIVRNSAGEDFAADGYLIMPFAWFREQTNDVASLRPVRDGSLRVASRPVGAVVVVSGVWRGRTPAIFDELPAGRHRVRLGAPGYWCLDEMVEVHPGEEATVDVELRSGGPPPVSGSGATWAHDASGVRFVSVPVAGDEPARLALQAPAPEGPFWIGRTEVTNRQFKAFVDATGYEVEGEWEFDPARGKLPAADVTHEDARAFCAWLGGRLPTEGEWEWAGRGPSLPPFPWGHVMRDDLHVGGDTEVGGSARPVGSIPAGASWCGAVDIVGNVSEWCLEVFSEDQADHCRLFGPEEKAKKAPLRGGSYVHGPAACRPTWRYIGDRNGSGPLDGFRAAIPSIAAAPPGNE